VAAQFTSVVVVVCAIEFIRAACWVIAFGYLDGGDLEVVLCLAGGVGSKEEAVGCVGFVSVSA
jgi:hypothetical protein